jgi:cyclopropane-fatty-acyl-phospholipid synthase
MSVAPQSLPPITAGKPPLAARLLLKMLARSERGRLCLTLPDGEERQFSASVDGPSAALAIHDWRSVGRMLKAGDIGIAEAWRDGWISTPDMTQFLLWCIANQAALADAFYGGRIAALYYRIAHALRPNSRRGARRNIHAHYDLGNDFYRLWLDETMTYSSALYADEHTPLAAAQNAKYERLLTLLEPRAGAHLLEIGCGWGGFAEYAARTRGLRITGLTLSNAQLAYAQARMQRAGLSAQVDLRLCDYRDVTGSYDGIVSIEMIEAVGERYWPTYFRALHDRLKPGGSAVVQGIVIDEAAFANYRATSDFIREYIFPGGMLATLPRLAALAREAGLFPKPPFTFGAHYARTLREWRAAFDAHEAKIDALGFDERFRQVWRYYFHYCEAGFLSGRTDVAQIQFHRP